MALDGDEPGEEVVGESVVPAAGWVVGVPLLRFGAG